MARVRRRTKTRPFVDGIVAVDYETDGLEPHYGHKPFLAGMEDEDGNVLKVDLRRARGLAPDIAGRAKADRVRRVVENPNIVKVSHNAKFEIRMSRALGWKPRGKWLDLMDMVVLVNEYESSLRLKMLSRKFLSEPYEEDDAIKKWLSQENRRRRAPWLKSLREQYGGAKSPEYKQAVKDEEGDCPTEANFEDFYHHDPETMSSYLEKDLDCLLKLVWLFMPVVEEQGFGHLLDMESDLTWDVADMEDAGMKVDLDFCRNRLRLYAPRAAVCKKRMFREAGREFNPNAPAQLMKVLEDLDIDVPNTRKQTLWSLGGQYPFVNELLEYRANLKVVAYFKKFLKLADERDEVHAAIWKNGEDQGIKTGRFSIKEPGLQTLPGGYRGTVGQRGKDVRRAIIPRPGYNLFMLDYAQVEPRILTHYTGDERLLKAIAEGEDIYFPFVRIMYGKHLFKGYDQSRSLDEFPELKQRRSDAKTLILAVIYGMGAGLMAYNMGTTVPDARGKKALCFREIPSMRDLMTDSMVACKQHGFVECVFGRRYRVPRSMAYKAINARIQGAAAIVMKRAIIATGEVCREWNEEEGRVVARVLLTMHDELVFEIEVGLEDMIVPDLVMAMELVAPELKVPLKVDAAWTPGGGSWGDKVDWHLGDAGRMDGKAAVSGSAARSRRRGSRVPGSSASRPTTYRSVG